MSTDSPDTRSFRPARIARHMAVAAAAAVLVVSCSSSPSATSNDGASTTTPPSTTEPSWGPGEMADLAGGLTEDLDADGNWVGEGAYFYLRAEDCEVYVGNGLSCFGVNPASPYGIYLLPDAPGAEPLSEALGSSEGLDASLAQLGRPDLAGLSPIWNLREDEALVYLGVTPPDARYMGFANYVMTDPEAPGAVLFTETHTPVNNMTLTDTLGDPYGQAAVFITTANRGLADTITSDLVDGGFPAERIFVLGIPGDALAMGYGADRATFSHQDRVAYIDDQSYIDDPPVTILRVVPETAGDVDTYPIPTDPQHATGTDESDLEAALSLLAGAVAADQRSDQPGITEAAAVMWPLKTQQCLTEHKPCLGTIDANYGAAFGTMGDNSADHVTLVGIDHSTTGHAAYTNLTMYSRDIGAPVASFSADELAGTAEEFLELVDPADRDTVATVADQLYVVTFARDCTSIRGACTEVPSTGTVSLPAGTRYALYERAYLHPATDRGPAPDEILAPTVIVGRVEQS